MRRLCLIAYLLPSLLASGCMGTSEYIRPEPPLPTGWAATEQDSNGRIASRIHWRDFFSDTNLHELIGIAFENNRDLRVAAARIEAARAEFGLARAQQLPSITGDLSRSGLGKPADIAGTGNPRTEYRTDISIGIVSYELDFWNRLGNLSEAARANYLATEAAQRALRLALIAEIASSYFTLLEISERLELARNTIETREKSLELVRIAHDTGFASNLDMLATEGALANARSELAQLERQRAVTINKLHLIAGSGSWEFPAERTLANQDVINNLAAGVPAEALLARPDVIEAEQRLRAAQANIGAARAAFLPKILLTAGMGLASRSLLGLFNPGQIAWNYQPTLSLPLFDWGRTQGNLDLAEARKNIAVAEYEKTLQTAFREVADLLANRQALHEQYQAAQTQVAINEASVATAEARRAEGMASNLNVLDARRGLIIARQSALQVRRQQLENATLLYKALGGGEALTLAASD